MTLVVLVGDSEIVTDCVPFPRLEGLTHVIKGRFCCVLFGVYPLVG